MVADSKKEVFVYLNVLKKMEITDFTELNALNKLLGKVKFHQDVSFEDFEIFVASPIISNLYERLYNEYIGECKRLGYVKEDYQASFRFDGPEGATLKRRIDNLTEKQRLSLIERNAVESYLRTLISPYFCSDEDFTLLVGYFKKTE